MTSASVSPAQKLSRSGLFFAFGAYGIWGMFPIYFMLLAPATPFEVVGYRIIFSLLFCVILVTATRMWRKLWSIMTNKRLMLTMGLAGVLIYINWQTFILAVLNNKIVESSLGYFINPIFTVVLGVLVLRERLRPWQWVAVGVSFIGVLIITFSYGMIPWISLTLAGSFGVYGLIKKRTGNAVDTISGLTLETVWMAPVAILQLILVANTVGLTFLGYGLDHTLLLMSSGIATAVPLLLFGSGAKRLPLTAIGLIQYFTPVFSFLLAVFVFHEPMSLSRWLGFIGIWIALAILTADMLRHGKVTRLARAAQSLSME